MVLSYIMEYFIQILMVVAISIQVVLHIASNPVEAILHILISGISLAIELIKNCDCIISSSTISILYTKISSSIIRGVKGRKMSRNEKRFLLDFIKIVQI